jgi:hypothetical protein
MCPIVLSSVAPLAVGYFSSISPKRHDILSGGGDVDVIIEYYMYVLIFSTPFV